MDHEDSNKELEMLKLAMQQEREARLNEKLAKLDKIEELVSEVRKAHESIGSLNSLAQKTDKKIPPLNTTGAAAILILGLLGLQFKDLWEARAQLTNLGVPVENAVSQLEAATGQNKELSSTIQTQSNRLNDSLEESRTLLAGYTSMISDSAKRVQEFENKLSKLSYQVELLTSMVSKSRNTSPNTAGDDESFPSSMNGILAQLFEDDNTPQGLLARAYMEKENGNYEVARQLAVRAKAAHSGGPETVYDILIAQIYHDEQEYGKALGAWRKALEIAPEEEKGTILNNLGSAYFASSLNETDSTKKIAYLEKSVESLNSSLEYGDEDGSVRFNLAVSFKELGDYAKAIEIIDGIDAPDVADRRYVVAACYALLGREAAAFSNLAASLNMDSVLALRAAVDDDFKLLRGGQEFPEILRHHLPVELVRDILKSWADESESV